MRVILAMCGVFVGGIISITRTQESSYAEYSFPKNCEVNERLPNLLDPHSYYYCHKDGILEMKCVTGTFFNVTAGRCTMDDVKQAAHGEEKEEGDKHESETVSRCPQPSSPPKGIRCPQVDPLKYSIYAPDYESCECFYQCDNGRAKRRACGLGFHFNATTNLCDWPEEAGCIQYYKNPYNNNDLYKLDFDNNDSEFFKLDRLHPVAIKQFNNK